LVNKEELYQRLDEIKEAIDFLRKIKSEELEIKERFLLARYHLQIILEAMFTIGNQIIANHLFRKPTAYKDILTILCENKILDKDLHEKLIPFADLRNRLVHSYWKISKEELMQIIEAQLIYFQRFLETIVNYTDKGTV
jgi:uncharacterized protein YutE (UPF0331/DUF86 family)